MRTINIDIYSFTELDEPGRKHALQYFNDINVDQNWWEQVYEDFENMAACFGIMVDPKAIYFNGLYGQGVGSSYKAVVDILTLLSCIQNSSWKEYAPNEMFQFGLAYDKRLPGLIQKGLISAHAVTDNNAAGNHILPKFYYTINGNNDRSYPNIELALTQLEEVFSAACHELNRWLYHNLQKEYEYRTSEAMVSESIISNGYEFLKDGSFLASKFKEPLLK